MSVKFLFSFSWRTITAAIMSKV